MKPQMLYNTEQMALEIRYYNGKCITEKVEFIHRMWKS